MVTQTDRLYCGTRPWKVWSRLVAYTLFEERPASTRVWFINPFVPLFHRLVTCLTELKKALKPVSLIGAEHSGIAITGKIVSMNREIGFLNEFDLLRHVGHPGEDLIGSFADQPPSYRLGAAEVTPLREKVMHRLLGAYPRLSGLRCFVDKCLEDSVTVAYGGDQAVRASAGDILEPNLPPSYALALCRIEPDNNVALILKSFSKMPGHPLVFVGNWEIGDCGRKLKKEYQSFSHIRLVDPIYEESRLYAVRASARKYTHCHSAGGTNPPLVEMMIFGIPVVAFDCVFIACCVLSVSSRNKKRVRPKGEAAFSCFRLNVICSNRNTTDERTHCFDSAESLEQAVSSVDAANGTAMLEIARRRYRWDRVVYDYLTPISPDQLLKQNDVVRVC